MVLCAGNSADRVGRRGCSKMVTAGTLHTSLVYSRAWSGQQRGSNRAPGGGSCNLRLPQSGLFCRQIARSLPKNNYTSRAYVGRGLKAECVLGGAATSPESSVGVAGEANV